MCRLQQRATVALEHAGATRMTRLERAKAAEQTFRSVAQKIALKLLAFAPIGSAFPRSSLSNFPHEIPP